MRLSPVQRIALTMLARDGAVLTRILCMNDREPIKITAGHDVLKVAHVTWRALLNRWWIYRAGEEQRTYTIMTYKITEAGRKVL